MKQKVFFLIRDKLGDSLIAAQAVLALRDQYPELDITLMMRAEYSYFLREEKNLRLIPYFYHFQAWCRLAWLRLHSAFDAFIVLRGFGEKVAQLGKWVHARKKIHRQGSFPHIFTLYPEQSVQESDPLIERSWQTLRLYVPTLQAMQRLHFPSLVAKHRETPSTFIGICPITDEARKNLSLVALAQLVQYIQQHHSQPIHILVRKKDEGKPYFAYSQEKNIPIVVFKNTRRLLSLFSQMHYYYGADTGLYHLAAAMDIPATVVFGPTLPHQVVLAEQKTYAIRLKGLSNKPCEQKSCQHAVCIELATANLLSSSIAISLHTTPVGCPLRKLPAEALLLNQVSGCHNEKKISPHPPR